MYVTCRTSTKKKRLPETSNPQMLACCCISFSLGLFTGRWCCHPHLPFPMYPLSSFHGPSALCRGREKRCCMPPPTHLPFPLFTGRRHFAPPVYWCCMPPPMYHLSSFHGPSALCRGREKRCCMPPPMYPFLFHGPSALRPARLLVLHATSMYRLSSFHGPSALCRGRQCTLSSFTGRRHFAPPVYWCCMPPPMYHLSSFHGPSALCRGRARKELLHATPNVPFPLSRAVGTSPRPFIGVACHPQCTTFPLFTDRRHFAAAVKRGVAPQTLNPEL